MDERRCQLEAVSLPSTVQSFMSRCPRAPPHSVRKGRLRCEVLRTVARCVEQHVQSTKFNGFCVALYCFVRYPRSCELGGTYPRNPPPPKGRAPCRNLKTTRTLTPPTSLWRVRIALCSCFLTNFLILKVVASAYSSRSTRNASAASLDGLAPANVAMQRARWRTKLRAVGG